MQKCLLLFPQLRDSGPKALCGGRASVALSGGGGQGDPGEA